MIGVWVRECYRGMGKGVTRWAFRGLGFIINKTVWETFAILFPYHHNNNNLNIAFFTGGGGRGGGGAIGEFWG